MLKTTLANLFIGRFSICFNIKRDVNFLSILEQNYLLDVNDLNIIT